MDDLARLNEQDRLVREMAVKLRVPMDRVVDRIESLLAEKRELEDALAALRREFDRPTET